MPESNGKVPRVQCYSNDIPKGPKAPKLASLRGRTLCWRSLKNCTHRIHARYSFQEQYSKTRPLIEALSELSLSESQNTGCISAQDEMWWEHCRNLLCCTVLYCTVLSCPVL